MRLIKKIRNYYLFNREMKILLIEAYLYLMWARFMKKMPFVKVSSNLGSYMEETSTEVEEYNRSILKKVSQAIHIMSRYTFWESQCMVKAIAGMKMLNRRKIESTIYFGTGRDEKGNLIAHAWLRSGPFYISGAEGMSRFTVVGKFANKISS
ncbi:lasso peptide biosynthesis B2 protein [Bacillus sp. NEB1478]|uniref:lasso peptide biosynthesis B2 protein n=1 Tax=Bacillus sp. NEB1478 TaxID=3073816 RepID=UPI00287329B3|nr:lasso peptide biosynthesis B2 protein [Bacillus sp. NEB1478]WNB92450.1 lasso peptide biosynthesis B2 protein [Bacillus sp. NEB1478]